jgi:glycosyltransferase involved in cell wall biosynthesis
MKIAVHCQNLAQTQLPGIGNYLLSLSTALLNLDTGNEYFFISGSELAHRPQAPGFQHCVVKPSRFVSYLGFPQACHRLNCDLAFMPKETVPPLLKIPTVISVFDLYSFRCPRELRGEIPFSAKAHFWMAKTFHFNRAAKILTISEDTKKDLMEMFGVREDKICVTPLGVNTELFFPRAQEEIEQVKAHYGISRPYFINTSSYWWGRKNLVRLIEAFALLKKREGFPHQLVITGKRGPSYDAMQMVIARHRVQEDVKLLEFIPTSMLPSLLSGAEALVFPSLHEGFGLPVIEAMSCGCPVITSANSALKEVGRAASLFVDPWEVESIVDAMKTLGEDLNLRKRLVFDGVQRAKEYTWELTARKTLEAFQASK